MSQPKNIPVVVCRAMLVVAALLVALALVLVTWVGRDLRLLAPAIFSALGDEWRRILLLFVGPTWKSAWSFTLVNAA
jgi:hypothetical protein